MGVWSQASQFGQGAEEERRKMVRRMVVPNPDEGWEVKGPGAKRSSGHFDTQKDAIARAKEIVGRAGGGEVTICGKDGKIRDSDTVAPGHDPCPPRDTK